MQRHCPDPPQAAIIIKQTTIKTTTTTAATYHNIAPSHLANVTSM